MISAQELASFNIDQDASLNEEALLKLGDVGALEKGLNTNFQSGLTTNEEDFEERIKQFGRNSLPEPEAQTWLSMFLESFEDTTIIVLVVAAIVSLGVGLYEDPSKGWLEGAAILSSVFIVAIVTATNNYNKEQQFRKLNAVKDDSKIGVLRDGIVQDINVRQLLVGDIVVLNSGDKIPGDGILLSGSDVSCDESALTGESEEKLKCPTAKEGYDRFMLSGTSLTTGCGRMLLTAVGVDSRWGKTKAKLAGETVDTPLQEKLEVLAGQIGNVGLASAVATFVAMLCIWYLYPSTRKPEDTFFEFVLEAFIMGVTIVVVAVPEGLPLAVTLSLAFSTKKMQKDNNLIRVLAACETMGNATNICSDKTGTLTQNKMTVVSGWLSGRYYENFSGNDGFSPENKALTYIAEGISVNSTAALSVNYSVYTAVTGLPVDMSNPPTFDNAAIPSQAIVVNGNKTEGALLLFVKDVLNRDFNVLRNSLFNEKRGDKLFTFTSERKRMTALLNVGPGRQGVAYTKGASEVVLGKCTCYLDTTGQTQTMTPEILKVLQTTIQNMAKNALRTIAIAHRKVASITGQETVDDIEKGLVLDAIVGIKDPLRPEVVQAVQECQAAGIFVRMVTGDNIETAVAIAKECGIYTQGGEAMEGPKFRTLTPAQLDAKLPYLQVLARSSPEDKYLLVTRLNGNNLPSNQEEWEAQHPGRSWEKERDLLLPGYLDEWKEHPGRKAFGGVGEVVGATGDGTNDAPALKAADVGLAVMSGTDVAKDASDIVIMDDNFSSIVKSVMWGRAVFDNIRKFLQFQLTVNLVALTVTFLAAVRGQEPPLNAVMMLWVNLIMDTMGALALGTEPPSPTLLLRRPYKRNASLISNTMIRNILVQFIFQISLLVYLHNYALNDFNVPIPSQQVTVSATPTLSSWKSFLTHALFNTTTVKKAAKAVVNHATSSSLVTIRNTIMFNTFVFCQVFNELNSRSITSDSNVFSNLMNNPIFLFIIVITVIVQIAIVELGGPFVKTASLDAVQWIKCILLGALSLPVGGLMRWIPVKDSDSDFAVVPDILVKKSEQAKEKLVSSKTFMTAEIKSEQRISGQVWLLTVLLIPLLAYLAFEQHWQARLVALAAIIPKNY